jgi:MFS family permease
VLYLPYSLVGPFAGVFIDRWSRRQILVWSALLRSAFVALAAVFMALGNRGVPLYVAVLLVLGVNRFFLSSLSAALPHVVAEDELVMANSVSPTVGGIMATIGGVIALGLNVATGNTERGAAITVLVGGGCYVAASVVAATMRRDLLGPVREPGQPPPGRLFSELATVAAGLAEGARYVIRQRGPAAALGATGAFSFLFGPLFLMTLLLYRNYFYRSSAGTAEGHIGTLVIASGVGFACAALVTPPATRRLSKAAWITLLLAASAVVTATLGETFLQAAYLAVGFCLYLCRQGVSICVVTILQEDVGDAYRGRVFAFYDMMFNVTFVIGAVLSAAFMPSDGHSPVITGLVAAGFAIAAALYWLAAARGHSSSGSGDGGTSIPSAAAQRSSS